MKRQFTIFLILVFVLGLAFVGINRLSVVSAEECPDITISGINGWFRPMDGEAKTITGSGFTPDLTIKFNNGEMNGQVSLIDATHILVIAEHTELLRPGNLILTNSCGKTATFAYTTYSIPQISSINPIVTNYSYEYNFQCRESHIEKSGKIYPGGRVRINGTKLSTSAYAKDIVKVYLDGNVIFTPTSSYHEMNSSCIDFILPKSVSIGNHYFEVSNEERMRGDKFYFEVSKHDCVASDWKCGSWSICGVDGTQTRECNLTTDCENSEAVKPNLTQSCIPQCREDKWKCGEWGSCSESESQTRICIKEYDCPLIDSNKPEVEKSCKYIPPYTPPTCDSDKWECDNWSECSLEGLKTRNCRKTFDCQTAETPSPATSQSCGTTKPSSVTSSDNSGGNINRDQILRATVKLKCPIDKQWASQGSGTIIDEFGSILTNKHVVRGTIGSCYVGFISNEDDIPSYNEIADVKAISNDSTSNGDMAILKIRNTSNKKFTAVDVLQGSSDNLKSGDSILPFGYPNEDLFGQTITITEGSYIGKGTTVKVCGVSYSVNNFFKTDALIDHGNSGGGAYQKKSGYFMGMPTLGTSCDPNIPSRVNYILSINSIKKWINSVGSVGGNYDITKNNFSNVSNYFKDTTPIEDINLSALKILDSSTNSLDQTSSESPATESEIVIQEEKKLITKIDNNLSKRVSGNILLQVEKNGEGWYVNPDNKKKYYLGRPADAFSIMRNLGLGIKHSELTKYLNSKSPSRLSGKILLDVEENGEAYYVNPKDLKGYFLSRPSDAFRVMRELGLGITNNDIRKIDVGEID